MLVLGDPDYLETSLATPLKAPKKHTLSKQEKHYNASNCASDGIGRMKKFRIFAVIHPIINKHI